MIRSTTLVAALLLAAPLSAQSLAVVHKDASTVGVYDVATGAALATLPTGEGPHEVAISGDGRLAVVTDYGPQGPGGTTLTVVDLERGALHRTIELPYRRPHGAKFLPDHETVAVTAERDGKVVLVNARSGDVTGEFATGQRLSHMVALARDGRTAYTANIADGSLSIVPLDGTAPRVVPVGTQTEAINLSPDGRTAWVGSNNTGKVFVVDVVAGAVIDSVQTPGFPYRIDFTPDGALAIVTNPEQDEIRLIDASTRAIRRVIPLEGGGAQPFGIAVAPDGRRMWVTLRGSGEVAEIGLPDGRVVRRFPTGAGTGPDGIGYIP